MNPELSIPVVWREDHGAALAGRLDVYEDRLHLDGGSRATHTLRDIRYDEIASARIGRENGDRINGRSAIVLELRAGGTVSFAGFDRPGTLIELLHQVEDGVASGARAAD